MSLQSFLLARSIGGPIAATTVSFTIGWFVRLAVNIGVFRQFPSVGGSIGAIFLSANVFLILRLGAAATPTLARLT